MISLRTTDLRLVVRQPGFTGQGAADADVARIRAGATPAGDADPYRLVDETGPDTDDDDDRADG